MKELILLILSRLPQDMAMLERTLRRELEPRLREYPGDGDFALVLTELERDEYIVGSRSVLSGDHLWSITGKGRKALSSVS